MPTRFRQVVIGVDPATTSKEDSDDTGIVVIGESGEGVNHHSYILEDCSLKAARRGWYRELRPLSTSGMLI